MITELACLIAGKFNTQKRNLCRGMDEGGILGLAVGTYRGVVGALVGPLASILEMMAGTADGVRMLVMGPPAFVPRERPPRFVSRVRPLAPYDRLEARVFGLGVASLRDP